MKLTVISGEIEYFNQENYWHCDYLLVLINKNNITILKIFQSYLYTLKIFCLQLCLFEV